jgi:hypothetical protein
VPVQWFSERVPVSGSHSRTVWSLPAEASSSMDLLRQAGEANPAVLSYVVGPDLAGEFEWGAVYVLADLDGYWQYLTHPAHVRSEMSGIKFVERFEAFDITDSDDPELRAKIAALQARNFEEHPSSPSSSRRSRRSRCREPEAATTSPGSSPVWTDAAAMDS